MVEFQDTPAEGFGMIPNWLVRESNISAYGLLVYVALTGRANRTGECFPSMATLAKEARCSVTTARKAVKELQQAGLVQVTQRLLAEGIYDRNQSNFYRVNLTFSNPAPLVHEAYHPPTADEEGSLASYAVRTPIEHP